MARVRPDQITPVAKRELLDEFYSIISFLGTREEVKNFFRDLLSESETIMLARRVQIAKFLLVGKGYEEIRTQFGVGFSTIATVHRWLSSGFGGYEKTVKKFEEALRLRQRKLERRDKARVPYSWEWLKKKYPLHFLLFNLLDEIRDRKK